MDNKLSLADASKLVVRDTMRWINSNKDKPGWMVLNFPSVFLFHSTHFRKTDEFALWGKQRIFRTRWLKHNFDGHSWTEVKFLYPDRNFDNVTNPLNMWLQHALSNPSYWDAEDWKPEVPVLPKIITPAPGFGDFSRLNSFNFKP